MLGQMGCVRWCRGRASKSYWNVESGNLGCPGAHGIRQVGNAMGEVLDPAGVVNAPVGHRGEHNDYNHTDLFWSRASRCLGCIRRPWKQAE